MDFFKKLIGLFIGSSIRKAIWIFILCFGAAATLRDNFETFNKLGDASELIVTICIIAFAVGLPFLFDKISGKSKKQ